MFFFCANIFAQDIETRKDDLKNEINNLKKEIVLLNKSNDDLKSRVRSLNSTVNLLKTDLNKKADSLKENLHLTDSKILSNSETLNSTNSSLPLFKVIQKGNYRKWIEM